MIAQIGRGHNCAGGHFLRRPAYRSPGLEHDYARIQILTIADLFNGAQVQMPPWAITFKQAERRGPNDRQGKRDCLRGEVSRQHDFVPKND